MLVREHVPLFVVPLLLVLFNKLLQARLPHRPIAIAMLLLQSLALNTVQLGPFFLQGHPSWN